MPATTVGNKQNQSRSTMEKYCCSTHQCLNYNFPILFRLFIGSRHLSGGYCGAFQHRTNQTVCCVDCVGIDNMTPEAVNILSYFLLSCIIPTFDKVTLLPSSKFESILGSHCCSIVDLIFSLNFIRCCSKTLLIPA